MVTETVKQGWFSRLGNAIKGILVGILLVVVSVGLLFWNEGRAVKRYRALKEGAANVISVSSDSIDAANEGKLVHMTGMTVPSAPIEEPDFHFTVDALKLRRNVEIYQWIENSESKTKKKVGGGTETTTTYTYSKGWASSLIDSSRFKESGHDNPVSIPYASAQFETPVITVGAFTLSDSLKGKINNFTPYSFSQSAPSAPKTDAAPENQGDAASDAGYQSTDAAPSYQDEYSVTDAGGESAGNDDVTISITPDLPEGTASESPAPEGKEEAKETTISVTPEQTTDSVTVEGGIATDGKRTLISNGFYIGRDMNKPEIGDLRVTFEVALPTDVSFVARQSGGTFVPYVAKNGNKVELLETRVASSEELFNDAQSANKMMTWLLRGVGFLLCCLGISMILSPIVVFGDLIPFVGSILGVGTGIVSFLVGAIISLTTIGVAWTFYRPILGIPLFGGAAVLLVYLISRGFKNKKSTTPPEEGTQFGE